MFEDAITFSLFGLNGYVYGLFVALGCLLAATALLYLCRKQEKDSLAAAWTMLLALVFGFVLARLVFVLLQPDYAPLLNIKNILDVTTGGFAMYGALFGAVLAALLGASLAKVGKPMMLDRLAVSIPAFLILARLGEGFTALGISRPLTTPFIINSFLALKDEYDAYLRTYLLEAFIALILLLVLWRHLKKGKKSGKTFTLFCLLYGVSQTLMESLRYDGHLRYSFIGVQQVLSAALFSLTLIYLAVRLLRNKKAGKLLPVLSLVLLPLILLGIVGIEFLIDRSQMGKLFSYALYLLALAVPAALGILMLRQEDELGQGID